MALAPTNDGIRCLPGMIDPGDEENQVPDLPSFLDKVLRETTRRRRPGDPPTLPRPRPPAFSRTSALPPLPRAPVRSRQEVGIRAIAAVLQNGGQRPANLIQPDPLNMLIAPTKQIRSPSPDRAEYGRRIATLPDRTPSRRQPLRQEVGEPRRRHRISQVSILRHHHTKEAERIP